MPVEQLPGVHGGTVFHDGRGHIFRRQREFRGVIYMVCAHSTCPARGTMITKGDSIEITRPHNHDPDFDLPKALIFRKRILLRCQKEKGSIRDIYRQEIAKAGHLANHEVLCSMISSLQRARTSGSAPLPPIPKSLVDFEELMERPEYARFAETLYGETFLVDVISSGHGDMSAIFMSPYARKLLKECEVFHIDGTFRCVPKDPICEQLTTITAMQDDNGFPVVFILMSKCSRMAYVTILRRILQEEPDWLPSTVIADYDNILLSALDEVFGTTGLTSILGCWFQYTQALWRRLQALPSLPEESSAMLGARMAMALPTLPPQLIPSGLSEIVTFFMEALEGDLLDQMLEYLQYVDDQWIEKYGGDRLSVNHLDHKLFYDIETLHHRIMVYVVNVKNAGQPGFWDFISGLRKFENDQKKILTTLEEKGKISKPRKKRHYQTQNKLIRNLCMKLYNEVITVREFLSGLTSRVYRMCLWNDISQPQEDKIAEEEETINIIEETLDIKPEVADDCEEVHSVEELSPGIDLTNELQEEIDYSEEYQGENEIGETLEEETEVVEEFPVETFKEETELSEQVQEIIDLESIDDVASNKESCKEPVASDFHAEISTDVVADENEEEHYVPKKRKRKGSRNNEDVGTCYVLVIEND